MALSQISSEIFNIDFESDEQKFWDALARLLHQIESQVSFEEQNEKSCQTVGPEK